MSVNDKAEEVIELALGLSNQESGREILGSLLLSTYNVVSKDVTKKILEVGRGMCLISKEKEQEILKDILFQNKVEEEKIKGALKLIDKGFPVKDVLESLEISSEKLEKFKKKNK